MTTAEERLQVLKMIQNGQITAEEGARLLETLRDKEQPQEESQPASRGKTPQLLRIRVTDMGTGKQKMDIRMPWSLVNVGITMGARFVREEVKVQDLVAAVQSGAAGKIVDVVDEENDERMEVFVE